MHSQASLQMSAMVGLINIACEHDLQNQNAAAQALTSFRICQRLLDLRLSGLMCFYDCSAAAACGQSQRQCSAAPLPCLSAPWSQETVPQPLAARKATRAASKVDPAAKKDPEGSVTAQVRLLQCALPVVPCQQKHCPCLAFAVQQSCHQRPVMHPQMRPPLGAASHSWLSSSHVTRCRAPQARAARQPGRSQRPPTSPRALQRATPSR